MQPYTNPNYYTQFMAQQYQPQPYTPAPYTAPTTPQLSRIVNDFNEITVGDVPTNGTPGFFIKSDQSEIQSRRWSDDGRIVTCRFVPEANQEAKEDPFEKIIKRLDSIEEKLAPRQTKKKEVAADE